MKTTGEIRGRKKPIQRCVANFKKRMYEAVNNYPRGNFSINVEKYRLFARSYSKN